MTASCPECEHPIDEHDEKTGKCQALDLPEIGYVGDCICSGFQS